VGEGRRLSTDKNDGFTELLLNADLRPGGATRQENGGSGQGEQQQVRF
jgi:hypothetical protein